MSYILDSVLDPERLADIASHEAANETGPLRAYLVSIKRGDVVLRSFEAMAVDSIAAVCQHSDLCEPGEKIDVRALADDVSNPHSRAYQRQLEHQIQRTGAFS